MLFFTGDERVMPYFEEIDRGAAVGLVSCANLAELYSDGMPDSIESRNSAFLEQGAVDKDH